MFLKSLLFLSVLCLGCFEKQCFVAAKLPQSEVDALNHIAKTIGATDWNFDANACGVMKIPVIETDPTTNITCNTVNNTSHIIAIKFKRWSLSGVLPTELVQLPYIEEIDFAYNYLNGSIPVEWDSIRLKLISLFGNRLSGNIPSHLGNITSLIYLDLEANQFSGTVPAQLGKLVNLEILRLSSNRLSGNLPMELAELKNLRDFRINDNNFNGSIPDFIQSWMELKRLEIEGSGLEGPIPSSISVLKNLAQLRISDINGKNQAFPELANMTALRRMILRSCSISGEIPQYIWRLNNLRLLDLSFNNLTGELPNVPLPGSLRFIFLNGNSLSGKIPQSILKKGTNVDLSYNNFTQPNSEQPACQETQNLNLNLFRSSSAERNLSGVLPCQNNFKCHRYFKPRKKNIAPIVGGAVAGFCIIVLVLSILYWRYFCRTKSRKQSDLKGLDLQTSVFTLKQIKAATNDFDSLNKIGEGGFGPVYKGLLSDGTIIAVKRLSSKSKQGNREFLNEIGMISCLQHPNLVKLYGCCIEEDQLLLVYEYMENNSLARALFGHEQSQLKLDWPTRHRICLGIAKGLAFLHEESRFKIVHRDIKPTNVLLDRDLNPKISDFGLAKLDEEEKTHISTRIAGTIGYMAPEYAQWGHLTHKADVYSFGVVAFKIAIGKNNTSYVPNDDYLCFLEWTVNNQVNG
ncbi:hypothetical protein Q3G72_010082 [Acer saccharum]|nr:hypothetical protein Q3G72_010082 [Acer saccharum]